MALPERESMDFDVVVVGAGPGDVDRGAWGPNDMEKSANTIIQEYNTTLIQ